MESGVTAVGKDVTEVLNFQDMLLSSLDPLFTPGKASKIRVTDERCIELQMPERGMMQSRDEDHPRGRAREAGGCYHVHLIAPDCLASRRELS